VGFMSYNEKRVGAEIKYGYKNLIRLESADLVVNGVGRQFFEQVEQRYIRWIRFAVRQIVGVRRYPKTCNLGTDARRHVVLNDTEPQYQTH